MTGGVLLSPQAGPLLRPYISDAGLPLGMTFTQMILNMPQNVLRTYFLNLSADAGRIPRGSPN